MRSTNLLIGGKEAVVVGYGSCGKGIALRLRGMGASVIVVDLDPVKMLEAHLEGFRVLPLSRAIPKGDLVITVTGRPGILSKPQFQRMKDGAIICNAGHFSFEVNTYELAQLCRVHRPVQENIEEFELNDGRRLFLLAHGELLNLAAGSGNPIEVMDIGLSLQALSLAYLVEHASQLKAVPQPVPPAVDTAVAQMALTAWGMQADDHQAETEDMPPGAFLRGW